MPSMTHEEYKAMIARLRTAQAGTREAFLTERLDERSTQLVTARKLIQEYMDYCSRPGDWIGDPVLKGIRKRMLEFLSGSPEPKD